MKTKGWRNKPATDTFEGEYTKEWKNPKEWAKDKFIHDLAYCGSPEIIEEGIKAQLQKQKEDYRELVINWCKTMNEQAQVGLEFRRHTILDDLIKFLETEETNEIQTNR